MAKIRYDARIVIYLHGVEVEGNDCLRELENLIADNIETAAELGFLGGMDIESWGYDVEFPPYSEEEE